MHEYMEVRLSRMYIYIFGRVLYIPVMHLEEQNRSEAVAPTGMQTALDALA